MNSVRYDESFFEMPVKIYKYGIPIALLALLLAGCQSTSTPQYPPNPNRPKPTQADKAKVSVNLLDEKCRSSKDQLEYEACIAILYEQMPALDPNKRDHFGERYDPKTWYACMQSGGDHRYYRNPDCDVYGLRRWDEKISKPHIDMPEIKWPKSTVLPQPTWGMSNYEYFKMLCEKEAGEVIYRTVENVEGVFQMRPTFYPTDRELSDRYVLEDPYSITRDETSEPWNAFVQPNIGQYDFLVMWRIALKDKERSFRKVNETTQISNLRHPYILFYRNKDAHLGKFYTSYDSKGGYTNEPYIVDAQETSATSVRFGYTWRGVGDSSLRERGIAGGEQAIVDLRTGEVLGWRRSFMYSDLKTTNQSSWWLGATHCSRNLARGTHMFIKEVLKPINSN